jgi:hypothetical protein
MSDVQELYKEASLSFAAYANLFPGVSGLPLVDALKEAKMSASQATDHNIATKDLTWEKTA